MTARVACPLCGQPLDVGEVNRDHVFGEAFGGRATVAAHTTCNSSLGAGAEGSLHRPYSFFSLVRTVRGLPVPPLRGTAEDGTPMQVDLGSSTGWPAKPEVVVEKTETTVTLMAEGVEGQLRAVLSDWQKRYGPVVPTWEQLPPEARHPPTRPQQGVTLDLRLDLTAGLAFLVKAALGAGVLAYGESFAAHPLADQLRSALNREHDRASLGTLDAAAEPFAAMAASMAAAGTEAPVLPQPVPTVEHQAAFVPLPGRGQTAVFVHVLGVPVLPWGVVLEGSPPSERYGEAVGPVLVREHDGQLAVTSYAEQVLDAVAVDAERLASQPEE